MRLVNERKWYSNFTIVRSPAMPFLELNLGQIGHVFVEDYDNMLALTLAQKTENRFLHMRRSRQKGQNYEMPLERLLIQSLLSLMFD